MLTPVSKQIKSAVFLDRDGVINPMIYDPDFGLVDSPANPDQWTICPGVAESIAKLNLMGFLVVVVTNQPGIAKGKFSAGLLDEMTQKMISEIKGGGGGGLDGIYSCLHHPDAIVPELKVKCDCRKPSPGMLLQAAKELDIDLSKSYMMGDGITDVQAGLAAGTQTFFISSRKCYICEQLANENVRPDFMVKDLPEAVQVIEDLRQGRETDVESFRFRCDV
jgi:D,D-heptose 1,7-bisphosphate phosphatase